MKTADLQADNTVQSNAWRAYRAAIFSGLGEIGICLFSLLGHEP